MEWYKVKIYSEDRPEQMKLIGDTINLVTWCLLKSFSELKITEQYDMQSKWWFHLFSSLIQGNP